MTEPDADRSDRSVVSVTVEHLVTYSVLAQESATEEGTCRRSERRLIRAPEAFALILRLPTAFPTLKPSFVYTSTFRDLPFESQTGAEVPVHTTLISEGPQRVNSL
jgi:hypothetical protein